MELCYPVSITGYWVLTLLGRNIFFLLIYYLLSSKYKALKQMWDSDINMLKKKKKRNEKKNNMFCLFHCAYLKYLISYKITVILLSQVSYARE